MKKYLYIIIIVSTLFSCDDDFLDRKPYDSITSTAAWLTPKSAQMEVNAIYKSLSSWTDAPGVSGTVEFPAFMSAFSSEAYRPNTESVSRGLSTSRETVYLSTYTGFYRVINYANDAIANLPDNPNIPKDLADRLIGEAKFLRGFSYFYLWQLYGGVIILEKPVLAEDTYLPRNSADEVKQIVIDDFTDAIDKLPVSYSAKDLGRATKGAAIAMLGKTYLYDKQWDKATEQFEKLMMAPFNYELYEDYGKQFNYHWQPNKEQIFAFQFILTPGYGSACSQIFGSRSTEYSGGWNVIVGSYILVSTTENLDGTPVDMSSMPKLNDYTSEYNFGLALIPWYQQTFKNVDKRLHGNLIMPGFTFLGIGNKEFRVNWPYQEHAKDITPALRTNHPQIAYYPFRKFVMIGDDTRLLFRNSQDDNPIIRYADVLLMYAEAKNEGSGPDDKVYNAINKVRNRAGLPDLNPGLSKESMRNAIRLERLHEFPGEGHFFFDLKRWRTAHTNDPVFGLNHDVLDFRGKVFFKRVFQEKDYLWPIPEQEREINTKLDQNPGW